MRQQTSAAVLYAFLVIITESASAPVSQSIKRTETEKAVEIIFFINRMAWKIFTFSVLEKSVIPLVFQVFFFLYAHFLFFPCLLLCLDV